MRRAGCACPVSIMDTLNEATSAKDKVDENMLEATAPMEPMEPSLSVDAASVPPCAANVVNAEVFSSDDEDWTDRDEDDESEDSDIVDLSDGTWVPIPGTIRMGEHFVSDLLRLLRQEE